VKESDLARSAVSWLNLQEGVWAMKVHGGPYQRAGVPDVIGCAAGRFFAIELKRPGERPSPLQASVLRQLAEVNAIVDVCTSMAQVRAFYEALEVAVLRDNR
jgi:VRR-NUC domain-containing protein